MHEVRHCKNMCFQEKTKEVKVAVRREMVEGVREPQWGRAGLRPVRAHEL